jgi:hypothetical protein
MCFKINPYKARFIYCGSWVDVVNIIQKIKIIKYYGKLIPGRGISALGLT